MCLQRWTRLLSICWNKSFLQITKSQIQSDSPVQTTCDPSTFSHKNILMRADLHRNQAELSHFSAWCFSPSLIITKAGSEAARRSIKLPIKATVFSDLFSSLMQTGWTHKSPPPGLIEKRGKWGEKHHSSIPWSAQNAGSHSNGGNDKLAHWR